ncbi:carbohydrate-binding family 9-like protein [bacterium]|nr:carbohydrate-binding family 9-like protein [bacterium]
MKTLAVCFLACAFLTAIPAFAEQPEYTVFRTTDGITINGILDEADWAAAPSVGDFQFPWWTAGEKEQTEAKMLWDGTFLYLSFKCSDKHIWADHYDTNSATCLDDCAEIFWNPNPSAGKGYNMFEMSCIGNLLSVCNDLKKPILENKILPPHMAQTIRGSVNNDSDEDTGWILEIAIRFEDYTKLSSGATPKDGDMWRVGLNRCGGKTNEQFSQWSPSMTEKPNFHAPDDFGKIVFSMKKVR